MIQAAHLSHRRPAPPLRALAGWLMLLPFVLLSLLPAGTMAASGADGPRVVLCVGDGVVEMVLAADGSLQPAQPPTDGGHAPACGWALHGQPLLAAAGAPAPAFTAAELSLPPPDATAPAVLRAEVLAPAARGPPAA